MGLPNLLEAVNAPTDGLLIAVGGNFTGDCSPLFPTVLQCVLDLKLPFCFYVWSPIGLAESSCNDPSVELALHCMDRCVLLQSLWSPFRMSMMTGGKHLITGFTINSISPHLFHYLSLEIRDSAGVSRMWPWHYFRSAVFQVDRSIGQVGQLSLDTVERGGGWWGCSASERHMCHGLELKVTFSSNILLLFIGRE